MSARTLNWYESEDDATSIKANGWNFQVAKCVASATAGPTYNVVWQSQSLAPDTTITWDVKYALGWTAAVPSNGVQVAIKGKWQPCDKGDAYDIDDNGYWQPSSTAGTAGWLTVGTINYSYPKVLGIHIVVGVFNPLTKVYEAVWVDKTTMPSGSSGQYQPQETVSWWLEGGDQSGQVFNSTKSRSTTYDFTNPSNKVTGAYDWSTSFLFQSGKWTVSAGDPPQFFSTPPPSAKLQALTLGGEAPILVTIDYARWLVFFIRPLGGALAATVAAALLTRLRARFPAWRSLSVIAEGTDGSKLTIKYEPGGGAAQGTVEYLGTVAGSSGPSDGINASLKDLQAGKTIPGDETWTISSVNTTDSLEVAPKKRLPPPESRDYPPASKGNRNAYPPAREENRYPQDVAQTPYSNGYSGTSVAAGA